MPEFSSISGSANSRSSILRGATSTAAVIFFGIRKPLVAAAAIRGLERLEVAQTRHHFGAEQADRAKQVVFGEVAEIELAEEGVERAFARPGAQLGCHGLRRSDQHEIALEQEV